MKSLTISVKVSLIWQKMAWCFWVWKALETFQSWRNCRFGFYEREKSKRCL